MKKKRRITIETYLKAYFAAIGQKGGEAKSMAKRLAAIENGKKGGRPKRATDSKVIPRVRPQKNKA